jgi:hypothetical protein
VADDVRYKPDYRGTAELMRSPGVRGVVELAAYEAIPFAKSISPDAPPYGVGYISSFEVSSGVERLAGARRAVAYLANTSDHAIYVEVGVGYDVGHHVLARTADHIERG